MKRKLAIANVLSKCPFLRPTLRGVYKVVFAGPSGAGKTTMIRCLDPDSQSTEVNRFVYGSDDDVVASMSNMAMEATSTIDFDFTTLLFVRTTTGGYEFLVGDSINEEKLKEVEAEKTWYLHMFGTPGQERFSALREWVEKGADGVLLLLDSTDLKFLTFLSDYYTDLRSRIGKQSPVVVCANKQDLASCIDPLELQTWLGEGYSVVPTVATQCTNVRKALLQLMLHMM